MATVPPVPEGTPYTELGRAWSLYSQATQDNLLLESLERQLSVVRKQAKSSLLQYENLLLELRGQGTLDIEEPPTEEVASSES